MNQSDIHLLDLPNELLFIILKKIDNIDVLYSLFGITSERLHILAQEDVFTNTLNLATTSSITNVKLDRFCSYILPRSHYCIKKLILETTSMERILLAGDYPNLTFLEVFNFKQEVFHYFTGKHLTGFEVINTQKHSIGFFFCLDNSVFQHIFEHQITDLVLHNNDDYIKQMRLDIYTRNVYAHIPTLFKNLKHLTIVSSSLNECPPLTIFNLPSTTYYSSSLTVLCINVFEFKDCLCLLDGRLKQLSTFIVQTHHIAHLHVIDLNKVSLYYFVVDSCSLTISTMK
jgi:hypothetical protein